MPTLGPTDLIIILVIVIVLFGVGRISKIGKEMGSGIRSFREWLRYVIAWTSVPVTPAARASSGRCPDHRAGTRSPTSE